MKSVHKLSIILFFLSVNIFAQAEVAGYWKGEINVMGQKINFMMNVENYNDSLKATLDLPMQGLKNYPLNNFSFIGNKLHFEIVAPGAIAKFDGELIQDTIKGKFIQSGISGDFFIKKSLKEEIAEAISEEKDLPYTSEEISFYNKEIKLAGTLTIPKSKGIYPAVILITGSGPQNRDEEILGFKIFKIIADHLSKNGIVVLRYDDRGVGGSTGSTMDATSEDFAYDAIAAVEFLITRSEIDKTKIGLLGHSEGGIVAPLAASINSDIKFIVLVSGTGVRGSEVLVEQQKVILKVNGASEEYVTRKITILKKIVDYIIDNKNLDELKPEFKIEAEKDFEEMTEEQRKSILDKDAYLTSVINSQLSSFKTTWFKFFLRHDPALVLENITIPVLMTFGESDLQVITEQNKPQMELALTNAGNKNYKSVIFPKANHLYQLATTGSPNEYGTLPKEFVPNFLDTILNWIKEIVK